MYPDFAGHTRAPIKEYIHLENQIIDGTVKQVVSLENIGLEEYEKLIALLIEFIDQSPLYNKYINDALSKTKDKLN